MYGFSHHATSFLYIEYGYIPKYCKCDMESLVDQYVIEALLLICLTLSLERENRDRGK